MLFADLVAASTAVAATRARSTKIATFATALAALDADEVAPAVAMVTGAPRQGRIGVGWRTLAALAVEHAREPELTIGDVDAALDRLATTSGGGSAAARATLLTDLLSRATATEADFLWRLLTGELRQGALAGIVTDAVAAAYAVPAAAVRRAAMLAGDLPAVAALAAAGGAEALAGVHLAVLRFVQPMLAATSPALEEALEATSPASVEWKLDGARLQAHRDGDEVRLYTRNGNDVTARLPRIAELVRGMPAQALVLDGEAIGLDEGERPGRFQDTMSSFGRHDGVAGGALVVRFFDCLHRDGEDLVDRPLAERQAALDAVVATLAVPRLVDPDAEAAAAFLDDALERGHEGVMVKALASPYEAGRRGGAWRKVKPVRTLDLVVLAAEWGHGRRQGWLSNLHLGARDPETGGFVMVGKTFKGMTDELLTWQTAELRSRTEREAAGTVHVRPELVVEIALDGVQASTRYAGGVALRFARVRRYRDDKGPEDADTIDTVRGLLA